MCQLTSMVEYPKMSLPQKCWTVGRWDICESQQKLLQQKWSQSLRGAMCVVRMYPWQWVVHALGWSQSIVVSWPVRTERNINLGSLSRFSWMLHCEDPLDWTNYHHWIDISHSGLEIWFSMQVLPYSKIPINSYFFSFKKYFVQISVQQGQIWMTM